MKDEVAELVKHARIRNRLLAAQTLRAEVRTAAERVMRLSDAGTPERFFTLTAVADESRLSSAEIVDAIIALTPPEKWLD